MKRVRRQFVLSAMGAIFVLLTVLLAILNGINFTMVAADGDRITQKIAAWGDAGAERGAAPPEGGRLGRMERMGPDSPELPYTARYFTYRFTADGAAEEIAFRVAALSREEALALARSVSGESGWVGGVYNYNGEEDVISAYTAPSSLAVRITDMSRVGEVIDLSFSAGAWFFITRLSSWLMRLWLEGEEGLPAQLSAVKFYDLWLCALIVCGAAACLPFIALFFAVLRITDKK